MNSGHKKINKVLHDFPTSKFRDIQFASTEKMRQVQKELLREHLDYCAQNSPYYRERLDRKSVV